MEEIHGLPTEHTIRTDSLEHVIEDIAEKNIPLIDIPMEIRDKMLHLLPNLLDYNIQISSEKNSYSQEIEGSNGEKIPETFQGLPDKIQRRLYNLIFYFTFSGITQQNKNINTLFSENKIHAFLDMALWLEARCHKKNGEYMMRKYEKGHDEKIAYLFNHFLQVVEKDQGDMDLRAKTKGFDAKKENTLERVMVGLLHDATEDGQKAFEKITPKKLTEKLAKVFAKNNIENDGEISDIVTAVEDLSYHNTVPDFNKALTEDEKSKFKADIEKIEEGDAFYDSVLSLLQSSNNEGQYISPDKKDIREFIDSHTSLRELSGDKKEKLISQLFLYVEKLEYERRERYLAGKENDPLAGGVKLKDIFHNACSKHTKNQERKYKNHYIPFVCRVLAATETQLTDRLPITRITEAITANSYLFEEFKNQANNYSNNNFTIKIPDTSSVTDDIKNAFKRPFISLTRCFRWGLY